MGSVAGLSGAAATVHGLALLGGGSLAGGGTGMAGGMWLVSGLGVGAGAMAARVGQLGERALSIELEKLRVTFRLGLLCDPQGGAVAAQMIEGLRQQAEACKATLADERLLNDRKAPRVREIETKMTGLQDTLRWMEREAVEHCGA